MKKMFKILLEVLIEKYNENMRSSPKLGKALKDHAEAKAKEWEMLDEFDDMTKSPEDAEKSKRLRRQIEETNKRIEESEIDWDEQYKKLEDAATNIGDAIDKTKDRTKNKPKDELNWDDEYKKLLADIEEIGFQSRLSEKRDLRDMAGQIFREQGLPDDAQPARIGSPMGPDAPLRPGQKIPQDWMGMPNEELEKLSYADRQKVMEAMDNFLETSEDLMGPGSASLNSALLGAGMGAGGLGAALMQQGRGKPIYSSGRTPPSR